MWGAVSILDSGPLVVANTVIMDANYF